MTIYCVFNSKNELQHASVLHMCSIYYILKFAKNSDLRIVKFKVDSKAFRSFALDIYSDCGEIKLTCEEDDINKYFPYIYIGTIFQAIIDSGKLELSLLAKLLDVPTKRILNYDV